MAQSSQASLPAHPRASLSVADGVAFLVGIVVGIGIFKTPQLVAMNVESEVGFIGLWLLGGAVTLIGALCYAELGASRPHAGGEYHFLSRAYGRPVSLLFAWARGAVIQTGAIAAVAFVFGDYASQLLSLGAYGPAIYAALAVCAVTGVNVIGTPQSTTTQGIFTALTLVAILCVIIAGLTPATDTAPAAESSGSDSAGGAMSLAMVFILLTYGGWNEAAYLSGEVKDARRNMARVLLLGTGTIVVVYALVNLAYVRALGLDGMSRSDAVAADLMRMFAGETGAAILSVAVCLAALSTLNATVFTGARVYYALGRDLPALRRLGIWDRRASGPANGLLLQGGIALALILFGAVTRDGFQAMVEYTAPVFWFFLLLVGMSLFVLRWREPDHPLPFRVPLYPITPAIFCITCAALVYSSIAYTGAGALVGIAVLLLGTPLLLIGRGRPHPAPAE